MYLGTKRVLAMVLILVFAMAIFAGCGTKATTETENTATVTDTAEGTQAADDGLKARTVSEREDANPGESVTPKDFPKDFLPGIENVGAVPKKKFKIAFSNGDMGGEWRRSFWEDMEKFAKMYKDQFGIEFISANSGNNSVKQLQDIQSLIAQNPDILIISPNESGPLTAVVNLCEKANIPLMTVDRALEIAPGTGKYISAIQIDGYRSGIAQGINLVKFLTEKNGSPKGNIAEIPGILGASPSRMTSMGVRRVLKEYPEIKIVTVRPGEYDSQKSFKAAQDILTVNKKGTIDAIITSSDDATLAAIEAIKSAGRDELLGSVFSVDGTVLGIEALLNKEVYEISEEPPFFGMITFEYAIHYLNGLEIPAIVPMPQRCYTAGTPEQVEKLKSMVAAAKDQKLQFVPSTEGGYDMFVIEKEMRDKFYPKPYWEQGADYLKEFEPYTESK